MTIAVPTAASTAPSDVQEAPSARAVAWAWARSTPGWLRITSIGVAALIAIAVVLGVSVTSSRRASAAVSRSTAGGALLDAQTLSVSLSDAESAAAGSYLISGTPSPELATRYQDDLAQAAASLSRLSTQSSTVEDQADLQTLATDIPIFTQLVQRAQGDTGLAVGASYLGEANTLMQEQILPAATDLYASTRAKVDRADANATSNVPLIVVAAMFVLALGGLALLQWQMSRRFRRTINPPMLLATFLVIVALGWMAAALFLQGRAVDQARREGSDPLATLTEARVEAQRLRSDDALTLLTRDTNPAYQQDYQTTAAALDASLSAAPASDVIAQTRAAAAAGYGQVKELHNQVREADVGTGSDKHFDVVGLATRDQAGAFDQLDAVLADGVADRSARFATVAASALDDVRGLILGLVVLGTAAIVLVVLGARRRLAEYR